MIYQTQNTVMPQPGQKYRLITRSDMDGLVCGILLRELGIVDEVKFVHPKDMQDGLIEVSNKDISTNIPYVEGIYLAFDHHASEVTRVGGGKDNYIIDPLAPSAARVVYDYFGGEETFPDISQEMMFAVDKADAAQFSKEDILNPQGWELLSFLMDARTGLGRFKDFKIPNYQLMMDLIDHCRTHQDIDKILMLPDVQERVDLYRNQHIKHVGQIDSYTKLHGNLAVLDLRKEISIWAGNRFMIYALFPECNISCHIIPGKDNKNTVFAVGKSILNRTSKTDIGELMLKYGGGGHHGAGTCQISNDQASDIEQELIRKITNDG